MTERQSRPAHYPMAPNSGIADAEAFRVGNSLTVHSPGRFPDANKVIAKCGVYGWVCEHDGHRLATWANAYPDCERCNRSERS